MSDQAQKWNAWQAAQDRAERAWADPQSSAQACQAACWEAECAQQQWSDAADAECAKKGVA